MLNGLKKSQFTAEFSSVVQGFVCGNKPWEVAAARWIREDGALKSIRDRGTKVWLYFDLVDELVGFGSIGTSRRPHPPGSGDYANLAIIPQIAVATKFWGKPLTGQRYSQQILSDLLFEANKLGYPLVVLLVHEENLHAIRLYEQFEFFGYRDADEKGYIMMAHRCP